MQKTHQVLLTVRGQRDSRVKKKKKEGGALDKLGEVHKALRL